MDVLCTVTSAENAVLLEKEEFQLTKFRSTLLRYSFYSYNFMLSRSTVTEWYHSKVVKEDFCTSKITDVQTLNIPYRRTVKNVWSNFLSRSVVLT